METAVTKIKIKKWGRIKPRLSMKIVELLRHKGGAQTSKKGARGYKRSRDKKINLADH